MDLTSDEWTVESLEALAEAAQAEVTRRRVVESAPTVMEDLAERFRAATGIRDGMPWVQPTGAHDAVPADETRIFNGQLWRNISGRALSHSPAEYPAGWTLEDDDPPPLVPVDPTDYPAWTDEGSPTYYGPGHATEPVSVVRDRVLPVLPWGVFTCAQTHVAHEGAGWAPSRPGNRALWVPVVMVPEITTDPDPDPDPDPERPTGYVGAWDADTEYAIGDVVDRDGRYYQALVAHGAAYQGTWGPPTTGVWIDIGPV